MTVLQALPHKIHAQIILCQAKQDRLQSTVKQTLGAPTISMTSPVWKAMSSRAADHFPHPAHTLVIIGHDRSFTSSYCYNRTQNKETTPSLLQTVKSCTRNKNVDQSSPETSPQFVALWNWDGRWMQAGYVKYEVDFPSHWLGMAYRKLTACAQPNLLYQKANCTIQLVWNGKARWHQKSYILKSTRTYNRLPEINTGKKWMRWKLNIEWVIITLCKANVTQNM